MRGGVGEAGVGAGVEMKVCGCMYVYVYVRTCAYVCRRPTHILVPPLSSLPYTNLLFLFFYFCKVWDFVQCLACGILSMGILYFGILSMGILSGYHLKICIVFLESVSLVYVRKVSNIC